MARSPPAKLADNAVTSSKIASGAVTALDIAFGAIGTAQIADGAITSAKIADGSITSADLTKPPRSGTISSATLAFDFSQASFAVSFSPVFNTTPNVTLAIESGDPFSLGDGTSLMVTSKSPMQFSGAISLGRRPIPVTLDNVSGGKASLAIVNGNPAVSYYDTTNDNLSYRRANDVTGTAWGILVRVDTTGNVGEFTSLAVVNGNPAISYYDRTNGDLKYVRATNANGTAWGTPVRVDTSGDVGQYTSLAVVNGNPAISYKDDTLNFHALKYVRAANANGTTWGTPVRIDTSGDVGWDTSLLVVNGNPAISYYDNTNFDTKYVRAINANGTAWGTRVSVATLGAGPSLAVVNGKPAISYVGGGSDLWYVHATDANGTAWGTPLSIDAPGIVVSSSLAVVDGRAAIVYVDSTNDRLKFVRQDPPVFTIDWIALEP